MTDRTKELLKACKEAGYEQVALLVADERVPQSVKLKKETPYFYNTVTPPGKCPRLVCGFPNVRGVNEHTMGHKYPKMWHIVRTQGLNRGGGGYGDCFPIEPALINELTPGFYDLTSLTLE